MESVLIVAALLLILANLFVIMLLFLTVFRAFFKFIGEDTLNNWNLETFIPKSPFNGKVDREKQQTTANDNAQYTPEGEEAPATTVPLDNFNPDLDKPIKIEFEEAGEDHGMEVKEEDAA